MSNLVLLTWRSARPGSRQWRRLSIAFLLVGVLAAPGLAHAQTFVLSMELQTGQVDAFGEVHVEADADGALVFDVAMDSDRVDTDASIRRIFFNMLPETTGVWVESLDDDAPHRIVVRKANRKIARSGARLDWRIDIVPPKSNARGGADARGQAEGLQNIRFRIFADTPLAVEDLLPVSMTRSGEAVQMVVTMMRGRAPEGARVRWVAGVYEPPVEPPILN